MWSCLRYLQAAQPKGLEVLDAYGTNTLLVTTESGQTQTDLRSSLENILAVVLGGDVGVLLCRTPVVETMYRQAIMATAQQFGSDFEFGSHRVTWNDRQWHLGLAWWDVEQPTRVPAPEAFARGSTSRVHILDSFVSGAVVLKRAVNPRTGGSPIPWNVVTDQLSKVLNEGGLCDVGVAVRSAKAVSGMLARVKTAIRA